MKSMSHSVIQLSMFFLNSPKLALTCYSWSSIWRNFYSINSFCYPGETEGARPAVTDKGMYDPSLFKICASLSSYFSNSSFWRNLCGLRKMWSEICELKICLRVRAIISTMQRSFTCYRHDILAMFPRYLILTPCMWKASSSVCESTGIMIRESSKSLSIVNLLSLKNWLAMFKSTASVLSWSISSFAFNFVDSFYVLRLC